MPNMPVIKDTITQKNTITMVVLKKLLKVRVHGETPPPANAAPEKVAANATVLLTKFGYGADELAALADADDTRLGELFNTRYTALETDTLTRRGKEIAQKANFEGMKHAYTQAEKRIIEKAKELGIEIADDDLATFDEKTRLEGILSIAHGKMKATAPAGSEGEKVLLQKLESALGGQTEAQKTAKRLEKELGELKASIPTIREQVEAEYFAERAWNAIALKKETLSTLSIQDENVLTSLIKGHMAQKGHKFVAEKGTDGFRLQVVDKDGNYVQMTGAAGNHSADTYIAEIYQPLVKKSNAGNNTGTQFDFKIGENGGAKVSTIASKAVEDMAAQVAAMNGGR